MKLGDRPSIKSLGKERKPLLDTLRVFPGSKTIGDIDQRLFVFNDDQLRDLQVFIESGGWSDELLNGTIEVLQVRIAARLGVNGVMNEETSAESASASLNVEKPPRAPMPARAQAPVASSAQPEQVVASTAAAATQTRTRRAPRSQPRVRVSRSTGRPPEGRRW